MRTVVRVVTFIVLAVVLGQGPASKAAVGPHGLFSDGMVLQQGVQVPIWGTADDGERVSVRFQGQEVITTARGGKWGIGLNALTAGGPATMTIVGTNRIEIRNVLVGEVWVCSGQSNMAMRVARCENADAVIARSANPMIRLFTVQRNVADEPVADITGIQWMECNPESVAKFSGVGYFFGRELQEKLGVPVGLINSSYGGTPAEAWTSRDALKAAPELKSVFDYHGQVAKKYPQQLEGYNEALATHEQAAAEAKKAGKKPPRKPRQPRDPMTSPHRPGVLYNGMIRPLQPYAIAGAIWYQGESNATRAYEYQTLFPAMIRDWRETWGQGEFPFLLVQLAPFRKIVHEPVESDWAELRETQRLTTLRVPRTAMAVITDVGDETNIHPKRKEPVGKRLALAARAIGYGEKIVYSGPTYKDVRIEGEMAIITFGHVGSGLAAKGGLLKGFTVAGADRKFHNAEARIQSRTVVVRSPHVPKPAAVRYGWANYPLGNLWNKEGLPASPFRTDEFPMITRSKPDDRK